MPKRNSPNDIKHLDDLNDLENIVVDKRNDKRKTEKTQPAKQALP